MDMLSNLQQEIKEKILTYLPIKEAGRTSILSSKWRYTWTTIPELTLSDDEIILDPSSSEGVLVKFVDTIIALHSGPIRKFSLLTEEDCGNDVDRWIMNLSRNGIREIELDLPYDFRDYKMHSSFFSCDELNYINLRNCDLKLPLWFKGFKLLHTLVVRDCIVSACDLEKLISSCFLLKKLILIDLGSVINIHAAKLEHFEIKYYSWSNGFDLQVCAQKLETAKVDGFFKNIQMRAPNLKNLKINARYSDFQLCAPTLSYLCITLYHHTEKMVQFIDNVPDLKEVQIKNLMYVPFEPWTEDFVLVLNRLKYLSLDLDFEVDEEHHHALALFQRAIHLQSLEINLCYSSLRRSNSPIAAFWEKADAKVDLFNHLQTVNIVNFRVEDSILSFVKFMLSSAPRLLTLNLREDLEYKEYEHRSLFKHLLRFRRLSPKAEIIFE